ncbi:hypothetical protein AK88_02292 [Plasmodium fragile]|uniref:Uncharacterized protein n=1 Tax=Plasmodium fragile TaxID=5857 RepID=A0A0D9QMJ1_PLAFR|nr:uncharacterized protein AK88_02292 [Plasmodium fragile]KJP88017.1 hypothetical protein AK88_02292 [Plasmodium fragile]
MSANIYRRNSFAELPQGEYKADRQQLPLTTPLSHVDHSTDHFTKCTPTRLYYQYNHKVLVSEEEPHCILRGKSLSQSQNLLSAPFWLYLPLPTGHAPSCHKTDANHLERGEGGDKKKVKKKTDEINV